MDSTPRQLLVAGIEAAQEDIVKKCPKLKIDENFVAFAARLLSPNCYFVFECTLSAKSKSEAERALVSVEERFSNRHLVIQRDFWPVKIKIAINNEKKLADFLAAENTLINDGSAVFSP